MALRIPVVEMHDVGAAVRTRTVELRRLLGRSQAESLLPFFLPVELVGVGVGVRRLVAHQLHEPLRRLALDFEDHLALELAQPVMHEKERNEDRRDADRHEPFVADVAGRMKRQPLLRKLVVKLLDERLEFAAFELQAELGNLFLQQLVVAEIDPLGCFHVAKVTSSRG